MSGFRVPAHPFKPPSSATEGKAQPHFPPLGAARSFPEEPGFPSCELRTPPNAAERSAPLSTDRAPGPQQRLRARRAPHRRRARSGARTQLSLATASAAAAEPLLPRPEAAPGACGCLGLQAAGTASSRTARPKHAVRYTLTPRDPAFLGGEGLSAVSPHVPAATGRGRPRPLPIPAPAQAQAATDPSPGRAARGPRLPQELLAGGGEAAAGAATAMGTLLPGGGEQRDATPGAAASAALPGPPRRRPRLPHWAIQTGHVPARRRRAPPRDRRRLHSDGKLLPGCGLELPLSRQHLRPTPRDGAGTPKDFHKLRQLRVLCRCFKHNGLGLASAEAAEELSSAARTARELPHCDHALLRSASGICNQPCI